MVSGRSARSEDGMSVRDANPSWRDSSPGTRSRSIVVISMAPSHLPSSAPRRRRRVTPQQYRRRRVLAAVVLVIAVLVVWGLGSALFGSDGSTAATSPPANSADGGSAASGGSVGSSGSSPDATIAAGGSATPTEPATTATPTTAGVPSTENPIKLYIAGDSDAGTFAPYLQTLLNRTKMVATTLDYKVSSGLARPDFFDWPAHFATKLPEIEPAIVIVTFGGNDSQGLTNGSGTFIASQPKGDAAADAAWRTEYAKRVGAVMDALTAGGRTLIWVGIPNDNNPDVTARLQVQDQVVREQVAAHPGVAFIDTWALFSGRNGGWADYVIDPRDGLGKEVRAADGFHLNQNGAEILALKIDDAINADLTARGAAL
ncbi:MAG: hypothetical protein JWM12_2734 [Ilumatobacteraceae bacterium]|nr:hypothetical protein [Ilumatobacteraceae bacterium]